MSIATQARERPIVFAGPQVRLILEGAKTQTRRPVSLARLRFHPTWVGWLDDAEEGPGWYARDIDSGQFEPAECWAEAKIKCPFGQPGDRLWVRETWATSVCYDHVKPSDLTVNSDPWLYRANEEDCKDEERGVWRSSIHMPRIISRLTLEITEVRVERLQSISIDDMIAEGYPLCTSGPFAGQYVRDGGIKLAESWDKHPVNRNHKWAMNPWVWALTFRRIAP